MSKGDTDVSLHKLLYTRVSQQMTSRQRDLGNHTGTDDSYGNGTKELLNVLKKTKQKTPKQCTSSPIAWRLILKYTIKHLKI